MKAKQSKKVLKRNKMGEPTLIRYPTHTMQRTDKRRRWQRVIRNSEDLLVELRATGCVFESADEIRAFVKRLMSERKLKSLVSSLYDTKITLINPDYCEILKQLNNL